MTEIEVGRDTVVIDESVHEIYKKLTEGSDPVLLPFRTMKEAFMWAASIGYILGERKPLTGKRVTIFRWAQFSPQVDIPFLKAIAIAESKRIEVLSNEDEVLTIAEEFANRGISELNANLCCEAGLPLWNLIEIINKGL